MTISIHQRNSYCDGCNTRTEVHHIKAAAPGEPAAVIRLCHSCKEELMIMLQPDPEEKDAKEILWIAIREYIEADAKAAGYGLRPEDWDAAANKLLEDFDERVPDIVGEYELFSLKGEQADDKPLD